MEFLKFYFNQIQKNKLFNLINKVPLVKTRRIIWAKCYNSIKLSFLIFKHKIKIFARLFFSWVSKVSYLFSSPSSPPLTFPPSKIKLQQLMPCPGFTEVVILVPMN